MKSWKSVAEFAELAKFHPWNLNGVKIWVKKGQKAGSFWPNFGRNGPKRGQKVEITLRFLGILIKMGRKHLYIRVSSVEFGNFLVLFN